MEKLILFITIFSATYSHGHSGQNKWSGAEHQELGNIAYNEACKNTECPNNISRSDGYTFSYGQALAIGDFYLTADKAFNDKIYKRGLKNIFKCINKQGKVHNIQKQHPHVKYPDCDWVIIVNKMDYLHVVSNNFDHFVWDNIKAYVEYHEVALDYAEKSFVYKEMGLTEASLEYKNKALFYNAFADHFLTDAFPAGHVRVPRKELSLWAKKNLKGLLKTNRGDSLAALLHNSEGTDLTTDDIVGLKVMNSNGTQWTTFNDGQLHMGTPDSQNTTKKIIIEALKASISEVLGALDGRGPSQIFQATKYVPWAQTRLSEHYKDKINSGTIKRLKEKLPTALKIITSKRDIKKMLKSLIEIERKLQSRIQKEIKNNYYLKLRIAMPYLEQF